MPKRLASTLAVLDQTLSSPRPNAGSVLEQLESLRREHCDFYEQFHHCCVMELMDDGSDAARAFRYCDHRLSGITHTHLNQLKPTLRAALQAAALSSAGFPWKGGVILGENAQYALAQDILGPGGSAIVHKAKGLSSGEELAVKVYRDGVDGSVPSANEAAALLALAGVERVPQRVEHMAEPYMLVMRPLAGYYCHLSFARSSRIVALAGIQVGGVLGQAHERGVVHRSVSPTKLVCTAPNVLPWVEEAEVGLAGWSRATIGGKTVEDAPSVAVNRKGYPFLAPEVWAGEDVTPAGDVYALGATLLGLAIGRNKLQDALSRQQHAPCISGSDVRAAMQAVQAPDALIDVVTAMMTDEPKDRPRPERFAAALSDCLDETRVEPPWAA